MTTWFDEVDNEYHFNEAFIASPGQSIKPLGTLGGLDSYVTDINGSGQVTGFSSLGSVDETHAFIWTEGIGMQDLGTLGAGYSAGQAINAAGSVAGVSAMADDGFHAFLWDGSRMHDLGSLGGTFLRVATLNNAGQVAGTAEIGNQRERAFLSSGGRIRNLNNLVDPSDPLKSHVTLDEGVDINQRGQVVANGCDRRTDECHAYVVSPLQYRVRIIAPAAGSRSGQGTTVRVKAVLVEGDGDRITDARAVSLLSAPCKVKFSASGAQTRSAVCMKYDATTNEFYFNWKVGATGAGPTTLKVAAKYKYAMPETITTAGTRTITLVP